jgi:hypothetical protein
VQAALTVVAPLYPVLHRLAPNSTTTTAHLGRAFIRVAQEGYDKPILYSRDINTLGA